MSDWLRGVDWGTLPDAIAAFGTLGALAFSAWVLKRERRDKAIETARVQRLEADQREQHEREQASKVTWWTTAKRNSSSVTDHGIAGWMFEFHIQNGSDACIHDACLVIHNRWLFNENPSGTDPLDPNDVVNRAVGVVPPGGKTVVVESSMRRDCDPTYDVDNNGIALTLAFRDAMGRRWSRDSEGRLERDEVGAL